MKGVRQKQVAEQVRRYLSTLLLSEGPYIYGREVLVTLTHTVVTPDLLVAKNYISVWNTENKQEILLQLEEHMPRIKQPFGSNIGKHLRRVPELQFFLDDTIDEMYRVSELLDRVQAADKSISKDRKDD